MKAQRVEKKMIKPTNEYFPMLDQFCFLSKNLYNHANYIVRQSFVKDNKWIRYGELDKQLRADKIIRTMPKCLLHKQHNRHYGC